MSRTAHRYSSSLRRSDAHHGAFETLRVLQDGIEHALLHFFLARFTGSRSISPAPNSRSKTARGRISGGFGVDGVRHEMLLLYAQAVAVVAIAALNALFASELERRKARLVADDARRILIHRDAGLQILAERLLRMSARQVARARVAMVAGTVAMRAAAIDGQTVQHGDVVAIFRQGRQREAVPEAAIARRS